MIRVQNGEVEYDSALVYNRLLHVGTSAIIRCPDADHSLSGSGDVKCQASGQWQPDLPTCIKGITTQGVGGSVRGGGRLECIVMLHNLGGRFLSVTIDLH